jgi:hypothetical protein
LKNGVQSRDIADCTETKILEGIEGHYSFYDAVVVSGQVRIPIELCIERDEQPLETW